MSSKPATDTSSGTWMPCWRSQLIAPIAIVFVMFQGYFVRGLSGAIKG